jgi:hypothetical protein
VAEVDNVVDGAVEQARPHGELQRVHLPGEEPLPTRRRFLLLLLGGAAAELVGDDPLVGTAGLDESDECGLGAVHGHDVLEEDPEDEQVPGPGRGGGVEHRDGGRHVHGHVLGQADVALHEHARRDDDAVEEEGDEVGHDLAHEEEGVDEVQLLHRRHPVAAQDLREHLAEQVGGAARPPVLLVPVRLERAGQLVAHGQVADVDEAPPAEAGADCQVHVLHRGALLPPAGVRHGGDAPHAGRAVEAEEGVARGPHHLLHREVVVEGHLLDARQDEVVGVDEAPTGLHQRKARVALQQRHRAPEEVSVRLEVGVEDGHELARLGVLLLQALAHGAGLVAVAVAAVLVPDANALAGPARALYLNKLLLNLDSS